MKKPVTAGPPGGAPFGVTWEQMRDEMLKEMREGMPMEAREKMLEEVRDRMPDASDAARRIDALATLMPLVLAAAVLTGCPDDETPVPCPAFVNMQAEAPELGWRLAGSWGTAAGDADCAAIGEGDEVTFVGIRTLKKNDEREPTVLGFGVRVGCRNRPVVSVVLSDPRTWMAASHVETVQVGYDYPTEGNSCRSFAANHDVAPTMVNVEVKVVERQGEAADYPFFVTDDFHWRVELSALHEEPIHGWTGSPEAECSDTLNEVRIDGVVDITAETFAYDTERVCYDD